MANNYEQFSEIVSCADEEQQAWLLARLAQADAGEDLDKHTWCGYEANPLHDVWIYTWEAVNLDALMDIICEFQVHFDIQEPWSMSYAYTCSKPRVGEFGGVAVIAYRGMWDVMSTNMWIQTELDKIKGV